MSIQGGAQREPEAPSGRGVLAKSRRLESPYTTARLLYGLKGFYTLKELEEMLGVPAQAIWRYTNFVQIPEKVNAQKILSRIMEEKLLKKVFKKVIVQGLGGLAEPWRVLYDRHFHELIGYMALQEEWRGEVNIVLAGSPEESALASSLASWLRSRVAIASREPWLSQMQPLHAVYQSPDRRSFITLYMPRGAIKKGECILLVKAVAKDWAALPALLHMVESCQASVCGALVVASLSKEWKNRALRYGIGPLLVIRDLEKSKSSENKE